jgi:hypothetical protein
MKEETSYLIRSQRDYSLSLKLQIVQEIEQGRLFTIEAMKKYAIQGHSTVLIWLKKYGTFDWENQNPIHVPKTPEQKIIKLEAKVRLLKSRKHI